MPPTLESWAGTYSRYVIDLNRDWQDQSLYPGQNTTGLFPTIRFDEQPIYQPDLHLDKEAKQQRLTHIWRPYHAALASELERIRTQYGIAVLFEAHSIASEVPFLFDGVLPNLNFGTHGGRSCDAEMAERVLDAMENFPEFTSVLNGRFVGGYITLHYANVPNGIHTIQLELSQATYLDESTKQWSESKAAAIQPVLQIVHHGLASIGSN